MKKQGKIKKVCVLAMASALVVSLFGCGMKPKQEELHREDQPLFVCQDQFSNEDDENTEYYYNYKGDLLKSEELVQIGYYSENGLAPATDSLTGKIGYVDKSGVFVLEPQWDDAASFSADGIALAKKDGYTTDSGQRVEAKYGYINDKGQTVIDFIYDRATSFYPCGYAVVGVPGEIDEIGMGEYTHTKVKYYNYGVIDKTGKEIIPMEKGLVLVVGEYIIRYVDNNKKINIYNLSGELLMSGAPIEVDNTHEYSYEAEKDALYRYTMEFSVNEVGSRSSYGHITKTERFNGNAFEEVTDVPVVQTQRAATATGYACGVAHNGETVIPYEYDSIVRYGSYYVAIQYQNGDPYQQTIDIYDADFSKTAENVECIYADLSLLGIAKRLPDGYFWVFQYDSETRENPHGIIDHTGRTIVPCNYNPYQMHLYAYEGFGVWANLMW